MNKLWTPNIDLITLKDPLPHFTKLKINPRASDREFEVGSTCFIKIPVNYFDIIFTKINTQNIILSTDYSYNFIILLVFENLITLLHNLI